MRIACLFMLPMLAVAGVSGPVLGYVTAGERVRVIPGIPGAAYLGEDIDVSGVLAISSERGYAVVLDGEGVRFVRLGDRRELARWRSSGANVRSVLLSPRGTAAAIVCEDRVVLLMRVPDGVSIGPVLRLQAGHAPRAISDDGEMLAFTAGTTSLGIATGAGTKAIVSAAGVSDVRFVPGAHDLIYTDTTAAQVGLIANGAASIVAGAADGLLDARAADYIGTQLVIADGRTKQLVVRNGDAPAYRVALPCAPSGLERLNDSTMRLVCESQGAIHIVHASANGLRVLAIPEGGE